MEVSSQQLIQDRVRYLRKNTDFVSTLFESLVGYGIIAADFDGNVIAYNEGARQIYGYAPEEIIGKESIEIFFPEEFIAAGELQRIIDNLIGTEERCSYEGEKLRRDGSRFPAQILFTLTKDNDGSVVGFIEIVEDLTERKQAERAAAEAQANAERLERLEEERRWFERLHALPETAVTARTFGLSPLCESLPEAFRELVQHYGDVMDVALEQRAYKVEHNISERLRSLAQQVGFLRGGPRDVVEIHSAALKGRVEGGVPQKAQAYAEEGRLMVLELMGYLVSYYRNYSMGGREATATEKVAEAEGRSGK
jgi:PAS domain S-box-containing protein